jgi:hypothetical protein
MNFIDAVKAAKELAKTSERGMAWIYRPHTGITHCILYPPGNFQTFHYHAPIYSALSRYWYEVGWGILLRTTEDFIANDWKVKSDEVA